MQNIGFYKLFLECSTLPYRQYRQLDFKMVEVSAFSVDETSLYLFLSEDASYNLSILTIQKANEWSFIPWGITTIEATMGSAKYYIIFPDKCEYDQFLNQVEAWIILILCNHKHKIPRFVCVYPLLSTIVIEKRKNSKFQIEYRSKFQVDE